MTTFPAKDPDAVLDYLWDWTAWLDGDTIASAEVVVVTGGGDGGVVVDSDTHDATTVTAWLSGGVVGTSASVRARVTTADARIDDRTIAFLIKQR